MYVIFYLPYEVTLLTRLFEQDFNSVYIMERNISGRQAKAERKQSLSKTPGRPARTLIAVTDLSSYESVTTNEKEVMA